MFVLARRILGANYGAFAAALFAFSPMLFVYSLEVRMYMLSIFVLICLLIAHWAVAVEQNEANWLVVAYGVLAALLFYVHYIGVFLVFGLFVHWAIASSFVWRRLKRLFVAAVLTILFVSPGIPVMLQQHAGRMQLDVALRLSHRNPSALTFGVTDQSGSEPTQLQALAKSAAATAGVYPAQSFLLLLLCAAPIAAALAGAVFLGIVKGDQASRLFLIILLATGVGIIALHGTKTRFMLPIVPLLVLALSRAIQYSAASTRWRAPSLTVGMLILCLYIGGFVRQAFIHHGHPWQNLESAVQQNYRPGDLVIFDVLYLQVPFDYFAKQSHFQPQESGFPISIYDWWDEQSFKGWGGPVIMQSDLDQYISRISESKSRSLWLVLNETYYYDPHDALLARLKQLGKVTEFSLPLDPDLHDAQDKESLRLFRISVN